MWCNKKQPTVIPEVNELDGENLGFGGCREYTRGHKALKVREMRSKEAPHSSAGLGTNAEVFLGSKSTSGKKTWVLGEGIGHNEVIRYNMSTIHNEYHETRI